MADADTKTFNFELVSPEQRLMSEPAWQVVVPAEEGAMGVRAGHSSVLATMDTGVVEVWTEEGGASQKIFVTGGFADITAENLTLLVEEAVNVNDIDAATAEKDVQDLKDELTVAADDLQKARVAKKLKVAEAKLQAARG